MVGDEDGGDGAAEAEHGRGHHDGHGGAGGRDDGPHGEGEDELGQEDHGGDYADVGADAADLDLLLLLAVAPTSWCRAVVVLGVLGVGGGRGRWRRGRKKIKKKKDEIPSVLTVGSTSW